MGVGFTRVMSQSLSLLKTLANTAITRKTLFFLFASQKQGGFDMSKIVESSLELIGKTPLLRASRYAAKAGATYVSPFVGRLDDICEDGIALVAKIVEMYRYYGYTTQVLAASIRHTAHIMQCIEVGADVATCPLSAIKGLLNHPLTDSGLKKFLEDYKRVNG